MKLYDLMPDVLVPPDAVVDGVLTDFAQAVTLANRVVVDINNVAAYWGVHHNQAKTSLSPADSPRPLCPWPRAWFEYDAKVAYPNHYARPGVPRVRLGFTVDVHELPTRFVHVLHEIAWYPYNPAMIAAFGSQTLFIKRHRWDTTRDGDFIAEEIIGGKRYKTLLREQAGQTDDDIWHTLRRDTFPVWLALSFTHCKNVSIVAHATPPKVAKKRLASGKPAGVTYKTLVIDGMTSTLRTEGGIAQHGLQRALHICRGHFATYTAERPLFGRVTGTVWKPMHTRGSKAVRGHTVAV